MKRKISYEEAIGNRTFPGYAEEVAYILGRMESGELLPIKSSGTNGKRPALYNRYWLLPANEGYADLLEEIRFNLSSEMDIDFYLRHPESYAKERRLALALSTYLEEGGKDRGTIISERERSFDIWGDEKFLSGRTIEGVSAGTVLRHCGISEERLRFYRTSEPFAYYPHTKDVPQKLLILENLDPFYSMRKWMIGGGETLFGEKFGTLIYGGGKRIVKAFGEWETYSEPYMKHTENCYLYAGDLDFEGIGIYESLAYRMKDRIAIVPFVPYYEGLIRKASRRRKLPKTKEGQKRTKGETFFSFFSRETAEEMKELLESGRYVPQEIFSILDYA